MLENLRKTIYELMIKNHMTMKNIADALDYSLEDVDKILFDWVVIPPVELERIAALFGLTKGELLSYQKRRMSNGI